MSKILQKIKRGDDLPAYDAPAPQQPELKPRDTEVTLGSVTANNNGIPNTLSALFRKGSSVADLQRTETPPPAATQGNAQMPLLQNNSSILQTLANPLAGPKPPGVAQPTDELDVHQMWQESSALKFYHDPFFKRNQYRHDEKQLGSSRPNLQSMVDVTPMARQGKDFASSAIFSSKPQLPNVFTKPDLSKMLHMNSKLSLEKLESPPPRPEQAKKPLCASAFRKMSGCGLTPRDRKDEKSMSRVNFEDSKIGAAAVHKSAINLSNMSEKPAKKLTGNRSWSEFSSQLNGPNGAYKLRQGEGGLPAAESSLFDKFKH